MKRRPIRAVVVLAPLMLTAGCALLPHASRWVQIRPAATPQASASVQGAGDYESAVVLINRRDYARALDLLQAARARKPDDVRVLNAFGVVYDKLGRFDLSRRYYEQAAALAPNSPIIANNVAYSAALQERVQTGARALADLSLQPPAQVAAQPQVATQSRPEPIMSGAGVIRLQLSPQTAQATVLPGLTGHALVMVNASGVRDGAEQPRLALASRGWSTPKTITAEAAPQAQTTISYPAASAVAAQALAKTLPVSARLEACQDDCAGIRLTIGRDLAHWTAAKPAGPGRPS